MGADVTDGQLAAPGKGLPVRGDRGEQVAGSLRGSLGWTALVSPDPGS